MRRPLPITLVEFIGDSPACNVTQESASGRMLTTPMKNLQSGLVAKGGSGVQRVSDGEQTRTWAVTRLCALMAIGKVSITALRVHV